MALSLESSLYVWQKVKNALVTEQASSTAQAAFKALKEQLAGVGGNPDLEFVPIASTDIDDASGKVLADAATKVYGIYLKKAATAVDVYVAILDDATDDTGVATDVRHVIPLLESAHEQIVIDPKGLAMATGVVAKAYTDWDGTTDSAAADCPDGFVILGAA